MVLTGWKMYKFKNKLGQKQSIIIEHLCLCMYKMYQISKEA